MCSKLAKRFLHLWLNFSERGFLNYFILLKTTILLPWRKPAAYMSWRMAKMLLKSVVFVWRFICEMCRHCFSKALIAFSFLYHKNPSNLMAQHKPNVSHAIQVYNTSARRKSGLVKCSRVTGEKQIGSLVLFLCVKTIYDFCTTSSRISVNEKEEKFNVPHLLKN